VSLAFSTKAGTLATLQGVLKSAHIAPLLVFTVGDWQTDKKACLGGIVNALGAGPWIVRSSCAREDSEQGSNAGAFLSLPSVSFDELVPSVERVITAYGEVNQTDEVLIQPMLTNVVR
jgi:glutamine kinase